MKKRILRRLLSLVVACIMTLTLPLSAYAATWDIEAGSIYIEADASGQTVSQGTVTKQDAAPIITNGATGGVTNNFIDIYTTDNATAKLTLQDVNINTSQGDGIYVGDSSAEITLVGENKIVADRWAAINVGDGDLTITSTTDGKLQAESSGDNDAAIGSWCYDDMSGSITITGNAIVDAQTTGDSNGAAIGSGIEGDVSGNITIEGEAIVNAYSAVSGAGIGSGYDGNMSGTITIKGDAEVTSESNDHGAGIGSGENGEMSGTILITGNAVVDAEGDNDGAGIGSGEDGEMSGTIHITGNADVTAKSDDRGAGIGSGENEDVSGAILIDGNATVDAKSDDDDAAGIGGGEEGKITSSGKITIGGNATVVASGEEDGTGIGAGEDSVMAGTITIEDNANVTAYGGNDAAAIGSDNEGEMTGTIQILDNAIVNTGTTTSGGTRLPDTLGTGIIGDSSTSDHTSTNGKYIISPNAIINGVAGWDIENLKPFMNMHLDANGNPTNLFIQSPNEIPDYRVLNLDGKDIPYEDELEDGVLTITVDAEDAVLTGNLLRLRAMSREGVKEIVFVTNSKTSTFKVSDLLKEGKAYDVYKLTHIGEVAELTLKGEKLDNILK